MSLSPPLAGWEVISDFSFSTGGGCDLSLSQRQFFESISCYHLSHGKMVPLRRWTEEGKAPACYLPGGAWWNWGCSNPKFSQSSSCNSYKVVTLLPMSGTCKDDPGTSVDFFHHVAVAWPLTPSHRSAPVMTRPCVWIMLDLIFQNAIMFLDHFEIQRNIMRKVGYIFRSTVNRGTDWSSRR